MTKTEDISSDALAGADENVPATDGGKGTASNVDDDSAPLHEVLNEALGTTFTSPEDAVAGLKDTMNYVGKAGKFSKAVKAVEDAKGLSEDEAVKFIMDTVTNQETKQPETKPETTTPAPGEGFVSKAEFERTLFYKDNPDLVPFKEIIDGLATSSGKPHAEVVQLDSFKQLIDAKKAHDKSEETKSVLTSSPRLGQVSDKMTQAHEALKQGNQNAANAAAVDAVIEAFGLK